MSPSSHPQSPDTAVSQPLSWTRSLTGDSSHQTPFLVISQMAPCYPMILLCHLPAGSKCHLRAWRTQIRLRAHMGLCATGHIGRTEAPTLVLREQGQDTAQFSSGVSCWDTWMLINLFAQRVFSQGEDRAGSSGHGGPSCTFLQRAHHLLGVLRAGGEAVLGRCA